MPSDGAPVVNGVLSTRHHRTRSIKSRRQQLFDLLRDLPQLPMPRSSGSTPLQPRTLSVEVVALHHFCADSAPVGADDTSRDTWARASWHVSNRNAQCWAASRSAAHFAGSWSSNWHHAGVPTIGHALFNALHNRSTKVWTDHQLTCELATAVTIFDPVVLTRHRLPVRRSADHDERASAEDRLQGLRSAYRRRTTGLSPRSSSSSISPRRPATRRSV
jgi:hypothetical protein